MPSLTRCCSTVRFGRRATRIQAITATAAGASISVRSVDGQHKRWVRLATQCESVATAELRDAKTADRAALERVCAVLCEMLDEIAAGPFVVATFLQPAHLKSIQSGVVAAVQWAVEHPAPIAANDARDELLRMLRAAKGECRAIRPLLREYAPLLLLCWLWSG